MIRWLRSLFAWRLVRVAGVWAYERNAVTDARRARRILPGGHSPLDRQWLEGGDWTRLGPPPGPWR